MTIVSKVEVDRFKPGDQIIYQKTDPWQPILRPKDPKNGKIATVLERYLPKQYPGVQEAYRIRFPDGQESAYYTKNCTLIEVQILGDDDDDCI